MIIRASLGYCITVENIISFEPHLIHLNQIWMKLAPTYGGDGSV